MGNLKLALEALKFGARMAFFLCVAKCAQLADDDIYSTLKRSDCD